MAELKRTELTVRRERAVLVGVILPRSTAVPRDALGELASLAKTAGAKVVGQIIQRRHKPDSGTYIGTGKVEEIADLAKRHKADVIVFDNDLSPGQIGALEKMINEHVGSKPTEGIKVLDRPELILKLFATLDTKTRAWKLERGMRVLLSDTVGFVRDLPHNLVASFKATLEEAIHADLLLHVLDVGHPHAQQQFDSVHQVLREIGVKPSTGSGREGKAEILLLNKIDTPEGEEHYPFWRALMPGSIPISAKTGLGLPELNEAVYQQVRGQQVAVTLEADVTNGRLLSFIESHTRVQGREFLDGRIRLVAVMGKQTLADLSRNDQVEVKQVAPILS